MSRAKKSLALGLTCVAMLLGVQTAGAEEIQRLRTYYFGNSFTGNTMPGLHPLLGESAGKEWTVEASIAPGIPIWAHMKKQMDKGPDYEKFQRVGAETDAIVMLIFGGDGLSCFVTEKWQGKVKFDQADGYRRHRGLLVPDPPVPETQSQRPRLHLHSLAGNPRCQGSSCSDPGRSDPVGHASRRNTARSDEANQDAQAKP